MTLYERVTELAEKKKLNSFELAEKLGLSRNAVYSWQKSSPKSDTLAKVAEYLDTTTDYLLGLTDNPYRPLTAEEDFMDIPTPTEKDLRGALETVMSFDGEEITDHDKDAIIAFMMGRKGK